MIYLIGIGVEDMPVIINIANKWIEDYNKIICPHCKTKFKDDLFYTIEHPKTIRFCPYCGNRVFIFND